MAASSEQRSRVRHGAAVLIVAAIVEVGGVLALGGRFGRSTIVRCRDGHLFTTTWIPLASLKAIRLGPYRFQRCPVGRHWSLVRPVRDGELTPEELENARQVRDTPIP